jgi:hypothetical protein
VEENRKKWKNGKKEKDGGAEKLLTEGKNRKEIKERKGEGKK